MPPPSLASVFKDVKKSTPDQSGKASGAPASGSRLALFTTVAALQGRRPQSALPQPKATTSSFFAQMAAKQKENSQPEPEEQKVGVDFTITLVKEEAARAEFLGQTGSRSGQSSRKRPWYNNAKRAAMKACRMSANKTITEEKANPARLRQLVTISCACSRDSCFKQFEPLESELVELVTTFSQQPKVIRDAIVSKVVGKGLLSVLGKKISRTCFSKLLRLRNHRLHAAAQGKTLLDLRLKSARSGEKRVLPNPAFKKCSLYLSCLYGRLGETLPHKYHGKFYKRKEKRYRAEDAWASSSSDEEDEPVPEPTDHELKLQVIANKHAFNRIEGGLADNTNWPLRYLPPGNVQDLYTDMCVQQKLKKHIVSYSTFLRAWGDYKHCLRFRQPSDFADCETCTQLKKQIQEAGNIRRFAVFFPNSWAEKPNSCI